MSTTDSNEYTPDDDQIKYRYQLDVANSPIAGRSFDEAGAEFDRWIRQHVEGVRREQREADAVIAERLATVIDLLKHLPLNSGESSYEPTIGLNLIDLTKVIEVAEGKTHPSEWVSVSCKYAVGTPDPIFGSDYKFSHSSHWWSDYQDGRDPLRVHHWCDGKLVAAAIRVGKEET